MYFLIFKNLARSAGFKWNVVIFSSFYLCCLLDIKSFTVSDFTDVCIKSINQEDISFKRQYILENVASIGKGFTYNVDYDSNNSDIRIV